MLGCPLCSCKSVVHALREWVLWRQSIIDVEDDDARTIGEAYGVRLMAVDIADDVSTAMIINERPYRRSLDRLNGLYRNRPVRTRNREPFEHSGRQLRLWVEQGTHIARALAAYRTIAPGIEAWNAALAPLTLHFYNVGIERHDHLGAHDCLLLDGALIGRGDD